MGLERVLLQTLKFDLQVSLPYSYVHAYAQKLGLPREEVSFSTLSLQCYFGFDIFSCLYSLLLTYKFCFRRKIGYKRHGHS